MGYDVSATVGLKVLLMEKIHLPGQLKPCNGGGSWINRGKGNGMLDPTGNVTRAEVAAILMRFMENVVR